MLKSSVLVTVIVIVFMVGGPKTYAQQDTWKTFYSPEKRFSIDYIPTANITQTDDRVRIGTKSTLITVNISPEPQTMSLKELSVFIQNGFDKQGEGIWKTTHPVVIDDVLGYSFTLNSTDPTEEIIGNDLVSTFIYVLHNGKLYEFMINESMLHVYYNPERTDHVINSIMFFD